jgi:hypothetical protein
MGSALYLASAGEAEAADTARLVARRAPDRMAGEYRAAAAALNEADSADTLRDAFAQTLNVIDRSTEREKQAVLSAAVLAGPGRRLPGGAALLKPIEVLSAAYLAEAMSLFEEGGRALKVKPKAPFLSAEERAAARVVPVRAADFIGPLDPDYLAEKLGAEAAGTIPLRGDTAYEALNFADGRRSLLEIARAVSAEFDPVPVSDVAGYFRLLEKAGLVALETR